MFSLVVIYIHTGLQSVPVRADVDIIRAHVSVFAIFLTGAQGRVGGVGVIAHSLDCIQLLFSLVLFFQRENYLIIT